MSLALKQGPWHATPTVWPAMFPKLGHDLDRIIAFFFDEKDLRMLEVCKNWNHNPCLIALQDRSIVEWRKDQAALAEGWHPLLIRTFRKHHITLWDIPQHELYGSRRAEYMPRFDGVACSIAQFKLGGVGLVCALLNKGSSSGEPRMIIVTLRRSANEMTLELSDVNVRTITYLVAAQLIDTILSDTQEICLPNRITQVLPEDSREIPWNIPSAPPRAQPQSCSLLRIARRIADCFCCCRRRAKLA